MTSTLPRAGTIALLSFFALAIVACGGDDSEEVSVCDQQARVQQAVTDLASTNILADGTDALDQNVENVRTELKKLREVVKEDTRDEVDALTDSVENAKTTFANLGDGGSINDKIDEVQVALTSVVTSAEALRDALDQECG
jgi:hypothetical protein